MGTLVQDLRHSLRVLMKNPGFAAVAILSLALGIGANTTIFTIVNAVLLNPLPVEDSSRAVQLDTIDSKTSIGAANVTKLGMSWPNARDYAADNHVFSGLSVFTFAGLTLSGRGEPRQISGQLVSANYFDVLGVKPFIGRTFLPSEDQKPGGNNVAVLSYGLWTRQFGSDRNILGNTLTLNAVPYTVVGVAAPNFKGTLTFLNPEEIWIPISMYKQVLTGFAADNLNDRRALFVLAIARLKPGISPSQAEASLKPIASALEKEYPVDNSGRSVALTPLASAAVGANNFQQFSLAGGMMMGVVGLVLLIACVNLANLLLAQAAKRDKEMSLRAALGASRARLLRQMLTESLTLAVLGGAAGLLLAYWGRNVLWSFRPPFLQQNSIDLGFDSHVLIFTIGISFLTGLLFGLAPAFKVAQVDLADALKAGGRNGMLGFLHNRFRSLLIVAEMALALVALVGAGLFVRSMQQAQRLSPGFESKNLFVFNFDLGAAHYDQSHGEQFFRDAIDRAQSVPGVVRAAVASNPPLGGGIARTVFPEGEPQIPGKHGMLITVDQVSDGFFDALRIPILSGRSFSELDQADTLAVAVVNEAMAKHFWPGQDAIGKRFSFFGDPKLIQIVGLAANTTQFAIGETPQPEVYLPVTQNYPPQATLEVRTAADPRTVLASVREQVQDLDKNLAVTNVFTIGEILAQGLWASRMAAALLSLFGFIALVLAGVGIYGVMAYSVAQRTREVGIRMALGARPLDVLRLVIGQGMLLAGAGIIVGLLAAMGVARLFSSLLYGVSASDPLTFAIVALVLALSALAACYFPARRAMRVDPIVALRYE
jgi:putative ABC transport system permease protein